MSEKRKHIQHYYTTVNGRKPAPENLFLGELSVNTADEKIMFKNNSDEIVEIKPVDTLIEINHSNLVNLRDNGQLIPGVQYRITDYVTTTSQENTQSAGHQFDIIVTATDKSTLNEVAKAIQHDGDTYFTENGANLDAWEIKYTLDNDTDKFYWADATNGKGVIYNMKDEWGNECSYDFKNIQFKHPKDTTTYPDYYYTFSTVINGTVTDHSMLQGYCYGNTMKEYVISTTLCLNNNVFINTSKTNSCSSNSFGNGCYDNSFGNNCTNNSFGNSCSGDSFGNGCSSNSFGNNCSNNSFGNDCWYNSFRDNASETGTLKDYCEFNHFDDGCEYNVIWNSDTTSNGVQLKNININRGVVGARKSYNFINIETLNSEKEININNYNGHLYIDYGDIFKVTYNELVDLRDNSQLIPGRQYGIIDYVTMTAQEDTQSANHQFDVLVLATSENTLSEEARAIQHDGDEYFSTSNLDAWKIWYSLDNDTYRFGWAINRTEIRYNSSACSINSDLVNDNNIITPFKASYYVFNDDTIFGNYTTPREETVNSEDLFYEFGYLQEPNGVSANLCIFKSNPDIYEDEGVDYQDMFFYRGVELFEDVEYDKWEKFELLSDGTVSVTNSFIYTNRIVTGDIIIEENEILGKGIIYRMIDEWNNDCSYDFKNILFKNINDKFDHNWYYTFSWVNEGGNIEDLTIRQDLINDVNQIIGTKNNIIKPFNEDTNSQKLNRNIFISKYDYDGFFYGCYNNILGKNCYNNIFRNHSFNFTLGVNCAGNTFGNDCHSNTFGDECCNNTFGNECCNNTFGNGCGANTFGDDCDTNTFGNDCYDNTFGHSYHSNTFGNSCRENTSGNNCNNNTFGEGCASNTFGNNCQHNTFANNCVNNTFGDVCHNITLGESCQHNTFGDGCDNNSLGDGCLYNVFGNDSQNTSFDTGCSYNTLGNKCGNDGNIVFISDCYNNTMGDYCNSIVLGEGCNFNKFGSGCGDDGEITLSYRCVSNTFSDDCDNIFLGEECSNNTFGNNCRFNTFGDYCSCNNFGIACQNNTFDCYFSYNTIEDKCSFNYIKTNLTVDVNNILKNLHIHSGFGGSERNIKETVINKLNSVIDIDIYQDENGNTCINQVNCGTF